MTLSSINSSALSSSFNSPQNLHSRAQHQSAPTNQENSAANINEKRQSALRLVTDTLTRAYEKIANRGLQVPEPGGAQDALTKNSEPMTATKAANTILSFIERRLQLDMADGATQEQLQSRLNAGLEGFKKGFAEAAEQLKALSMLSPEVEADIGDTYQQVIEGIDALLARFIQGAEVPIAVKPSSSPAINAPSQVSNIAVQQGLHEYAEARDFRFELITQEGDKVSIRASSSMGVSVSAGRDAKSIYGNASQSAASSFELLIEGDLNESELKKLSINCWGAWISLPGNFTPAIWIRCLIKR